MVFNSEDSYPGFIFRTAPDEDLYVRWSKMCDGTDPEFVGTKDEFLEAGYEADRLDRAEATGSSVHGSTGGWATPGFIVRSRTPELQPDENVFFWLPREKLHDYAVRLRDLDHEGAMALLEKRAME